MSNKSVSAGIIFYDKGKFLMGRATNCKGRYDIFKGGVELDETYTQGALRELKEESGIELLPAQIVKLGFFQYSKNKDLCLFLYIGNINLLPNVKDLKCTSMVDGKYPEMDKFKWVSEEDIESKKIKVGKDLKRVLLNDFKQIMQIK